MSGSCEYSNEHSGSTKDEECIEKQSYYQLLKKAPVMM
jgi:hypothetical protein